MNEKLQKLIDELANDLSPEVKRIESSLATTQNHYGDYGNIISRTAKGNKNIALVIGKALVKAGANSVGVANAIRLFV